MKNLRNNKFVTYIENLISDNPFVAKAIAIHIGIVLVLVFFSFLGSVKLFYPDAKLQAQIDNNRPKQQQIIQATSITSSELNKQVKAYEDYQQELQDARESIARAKERAVQKAKQRAIEEARKKAEAERKARQKAEQEAKEKAEAERKAKEKAEAEARKKEEEKQAKEKAKQEAIQKAKAEAEAKEKARQEAIAKAKAEAQKQQRERNAAEKAAAKYVSDYSDRVSNNWIKDSCRGIYDLPKVRLDIKSGKASLIGSSGSYNCDKSMINAVNMTTPPVITNNLVRQIIENEGIIEFNFLQR